MIDYWISGMTSNKEKSSPSYGVVTSVEQLGDLMRSFRKSQKLTLARVCGITNVSMRFLSELERGKETAEIGKALSTLNKLGLDVIVQPRSHTQANASNRHEPGDCHEDN